VIVGGHSHARITKPVKVGDTIIVQAWEHGKALGVFGSHPKGWKITNFDGYLEEIKPKQGRRIKKFWAIVEK